jgi:hypothetical protein
MAGLGAIGFLSPFLLLGLLALPVLWWLLRAVPPAPVRRLFPAVTLLLGLKDPETTPDKTPWWLLLLRLAAVGLLIIGFAGPILNPEDAQSGRGPLVVLVDNSWAAAPDWARRQEKIDTILTEAARTGRPVAVIALGDTIAKADALPFRNAEDWKPMLEGIEPKGWMPDFAAQAAWLDAQDGGFDTVWLSDGLDATDKTDLAEMLGDKGSVRVIETGLSPLALGPPAFEDGQIVLNALRALPVADQTVRINAFGPDPAGVERLLASFETTFAPDAFEAKISFDLPSELRNRLTRFELAGTRSAGATVLADDAIKRRRIALFAGGRPREGQELISPLHYLRKALAPSAELIEAPVRDSLLANPDVVILADVANQTTDERTALVEWVEAGGLLVRFAGPKLAAETLDARQEDTLLPVQLRAGGRNVGGAMSWGSPKQLQPFADGSPFFGLAIPADVTVSSQVIAQPDPFLSERTLASLQDGTPLVTRSFLGEGQVVLFHVTANAEWSNLPLSGLFVQMLERLAVSTRTRAPDEQDLAGQVWQPQEVMNGYGDLRKGDNLAGVEGERLASPRLGPDLAPGIYANGDRRIAINVMGPGETLKPALWPEWVTVEGMAKPVPQPLKAILLLGALVLLLLDILATLWLSGRLRGPRVGLAAAVIAGVLLAGSDSFANDETAINATRDTVLAYVKTGDSTVDATSEAGLLGLSLILSERTAIEPGPPIAIDLERDELAFFPILYWPITEGQALPSESAYRALNTYLRTGGMIVFDTRDSNLGGFGNTPNGRRLQQLAEHLEIPALEPIPPDHVLTRSFYLLQDFPGRHARANVWVEAAARDAVRIEGMPFRNLNDGVSPVVIGGNDWASAWAIGRDGQTLFPVGRGFAGDRQREIAYRFGVNLVMYVLTGNYKSDQVHVPALLERLGQ